MQARYLLLNTQTEVSAMKKFNLLSKMGCLVAAGGLVAGCGVQSETELDVQPVGEARQAVANGKRFNAYGELTGAARADLQVYRHSTNTWYAWQLLSNDGTSWVLNRPAATEDVPVQGNFDGDSLYDVATFRPSNGQFAVRRSSNGSQYTFGFGRSGDFPAVGDFDGDGATDHGIWRPFNGLFYVLKSTDSQYLSVAVGQNGDIPVIGNYDGDTRDDFAVWRPASGTWYFLRSSTGVVSQVQHGMSGDVPTPADYDGDGRTDFAVFRPSNGTWYIRNSSNGTTSTAVYGGVNDYPVPADYDGDGKADVALWRPSDGRHYMIYSGNGAVGSVAYGGSSDVPTNTNVYCKNSQGLLRPCNSANVHTNACSWSSESMYHPMNSGPLSYRAPAGCMITGMTATSAGAQWSRWSYDGVYNGTPTYWQSCNDLSGGGSTCSNPMGGLNSSSDVISCNYDPVTNAYNDNRGNCVYTVTLAPK